MWIGVVVASLAGCAGQIPSDGPAAAEADAGPVAPPDAGIRWIRSTPGPGQLEQSRTRCSAEAARISRAPAAHEAMYRLCMETDGWVPANR
jgi:hypothetical protein